MELIPGFVHETSAMPIEITEETKFASPKNLNVSYAGKYNLTLYPQIPVQLKCEYEETDIIVPTGANVFGKIYFQSAANNEVVCEIPVYIRFE